jgi:hypothetical protein
MNIASGIITFVLLLASAVGWFFFLMLALNGFSERDATPALVFFAVWTIFFAAVLAVASFFLTKLLIGKTFNAILALILSVVAAFAVGFVVDFGGLIASTIIASEVRDSYRKK